jgi:hypothetical protein
MKLKSSGTEIEPNYPFINVPESTPSVSYEKQFACKFACIRIILFQAMTKFCYSVVSGHLLVMEANILT